MILFCGYNGFQQLSALSSSQNQDLNKETINDFFSWNVPSEGVIICASWSEILFIKNQEIKIYGFVDAEPGRCISLVPPFKDLIIQAEINNEGYIFVCESGKVWSCSSRHKTWNNITQTFSNGPEKIVKISCGAKMIAALTDSGLAFCAPNIFREVKGIKDVACGKEHGILLTDSGTVLTWGTGSRGQLGSGELESRPEPEEVELLRGLRVVKVAAGGWHSAALTDQGDLYTWGWNNQSQLGFPRIAEAVEGSLAVSPIPLCVQLPDNAFVEDVACGVSHTIVKLRDGVVLGCGWNKWGQLGLSPDIIRTTVTLLPVPPHTTARRVVCQAWNTIILA